MIKTLKKIWSFWPHIALVLFALPVAFGIYRRSVFQACYAGHKEYASYQQHEGFLALKWTLRNLDVWLTCGATWAEHSHGILTAIATFAIAGFTWTLWRSTQNLWRATNRAVDRQEEDTKILQRAYLSANPHGVTSFQSAKTAIGHVGFKNVGNLPARNVRWFIKMEIRDDRNFIPEKPCEPKAILPATPLCLPVLK